MEAESEGALLSPAHPHRALSHRPPGSSGCTHACDSPPLRHTQRTMLSEKFQKCNLECRSGDNLGGESGRMGSPNSRKPLCS